MSSPNFPKQVTIGYTGEHNARAVGFDCTEEFEKWPDASPQVMYVRPTEDRDVVLYPGSTARDGNMVYWTPDAFATEIEGTDGYCQIFFYGHRGSYEEPEETDGTEETEETEGSEDAEDADEIEGEPEFLGKSALVQVTVLAALMAPQSDPVLESVEYASLYRRMQLAVRAVESLSVSASDGDAASAAVSRIGNGIHIDFTLPKGDAFTYSDFTSTQLNSLIGPRGEPFTYDMFTEEQLAALKGPKGDKGDPGSITIGDLDETQQENLLSRLQWLDGEEVDDAFETAGLDSAS